MDIAQLGIAVDTRPVTKGERDLNKLTRTAERTEKRVTKSAANMNRGFSSVSKGARGLEKGAGGMKNTLRQLSFQLNQVGQQGAATGDVFGAFLIQFPDILQLFGGLPLVLAGAAAGLGTAFLPALLSASNGARQLEKDIEDLEKRLIGYQDIADLASLSTKEFAERFGKSSEGIRGTIELLERLERSEAQRAIDGISQSISELLNIRGDGDQRSGVADFFDVNIFLAFTQSARDAREEARSLTSEFVEQQGILRESVGDLDAQIAAMTSMISVADRLANAQNGVNAEEEQLLKMLGESLLVLQQQKLATEEVDRATNRAADASARQQRLYAETRIEAEKIKTELLEAYRAGEDLSEVDVGKGVDAAAIAAATLAEELGVSLAIAQSMVALGSGLSAPGGPDQARAAVQGQFLGQSGLRRADIVSISTIDPSNRKSRNGRGGGGRSESDRERLELEREAERVFKATRTEAEKYKSELAALNDLRKAGLIDQDTYNRALNDARESYDEAVSSASELAQVTEEVDSAFSNTFTSIITGAENAREAVAGLLEQMADLLAQQAFKGIAGSGFFGSILGALGLPSADGGGFTGHGPRSGGVDGKGGFLMIGHPNETVIDHTKGQGMGGMTISMPIDARGAQAGVAEQIRDQLRRAMPELEQRAVSAVSNARKRGVPV